MLNQEYDNVLSLILDSDSESRNKIRELIDNFPQELLLQLNQDIQMVREGNKYDNITNIGNNYLKNDKMLYWYSVNYNLYESIDIGVSICNGDTYVRVFEMSLIYHSDIQLKEENKLWLGKIEYDINEYQVDNKTYIESKEKDYQLVKNVLGVFVLNYKNGNLSSINKVSLNKDKNSKLIKKLKK